MNILNVTTLIRNNFTEEKQFENTILFDIDNEFRRSQFDVNFSYLYLHPYSNKFLGIFKKKWGQYSVLSKKKSFDTLGFLVFSLPVLIVPFKTSINGFLFLITSILYRKRIDRVIRLCQPTLIQAHDVEQSAFIARYIWKKYKIPYIVIPRGFRKKRYAYINKSIAGSSALICHGYLHFQPVAQAFENKINILIPHGVDKVFFRDALLQLSSPEKIKIISIGRLIKRKNFDLLIKAVSKFDCIELDIYGDGVERDYLDSLIDDLHVGNRVRLIRKPFSNQDLPNIFKDYNLFALVSFPETFGRVYAEAFVSGLPFVGAKETGIYGQLEDKVNGYFVDYKDGTELEQLLQYFVTNPSVLGQMSENNFKIREKFSWHTILSQYYELFKSIRHRE